MNCPHCGSDRCISLGISYRCKDCKKTFRKIYRRKPILAEDKPSCPECGTDNPYSLGQLEGERRYSCRNCGKWYKDKPQLKIEIPILEVQVE